MTLSTHPNTRKYLFYPLAIIMFTYLIQRVIEFYLRFGDSEKDFTSVYQVGLVVTILGILLACYGILKKESNFIFIGVLVFGCGPLFHLLDTIMIKKNFLESIWSSLNTIFSTPVLAAIFVLFPYRKYFFSDEESPTGILSLLGTIFLISGLLQAAQISLQFFQQDFFYFSPLIPPGIALLVGIGILARERFLGIFGFFVLMIIHFYNLRVFFNDQVSHFFSDRPFLDRTLFITQVSLLDVVIFFMLLFIFLSKFDKNILSGFFASSGSYSYSGSSNSMQSKTCSKCGRSVAVSSTVGQRCPHCGVYWGYERKI